MGQIYDVLGMSAGCITNEGDTSMILILKQIRKTKNEMLWEGLRLYRSF